MLETSKVKSLEAVAYVSSAAPGLDETDLEALLVTARRRNRALGVTGVLLYHDGSFFQYFEGPRPGVEEVYAHIKRSPQHHDIIELARLPIAERVFPSWLMGFTHAPASRILQLSKASWEKAAQGLPEGASLPEGMSLLMAFWRSNGGVRT